MTAMDMLGNVLLEGDVVVLQSGGQSTLGQIQKIQEPSLLDPGRSKMEQSGVILLAIFPTTIYFTPNAPRINGLFKVVKPPDFNKKPS